MAIKRWFVLATLSALLWGCGGGPAEQEAAPKLEPNAAPSPTATSTSSPPATAAVVESPSPEQATASALAATPGMPVTRTPGPEEACPPLREEDIELTSGGGQTVVEIFEGQLLDYLNATGSASELEDGLGPLTMLNGAWQARPQVETLDVTGNRTPDVVIELTFLEEGQFSEGALFVYRCQAGEFVGGAVLHVAGQVLRRDDPDGIRAIRDMNANGVPEIVHSYISFAGTKAAFTREFSIHEWDGTSFVDLIPEDENGFRAQVDTGDGEIRDLDGDGTLELILAQSASFPYPDLGPERARTDIWGWTGQVFERTRQEYTEPVFRIHAIWDGDDATRYGDYEAALAFYQQAVFDEELLGWSPGRLWPDSFYGDAPTPVPALAERPRLNSYGRYRILLLHLVQGNQAAAKIVYDTLQEEFDRPVEGSEYAYLARLVWEEYSASADLGAACAEAIAFAREEPEVVLSPLGRSFYGIGQREYEPADICPFGS